MPPARFQLRMAREARMVTNALFWISVVQEINELAARSHERTAASFAERAVMSVEEYSDHEDAERAAEAWRRERLTPSERATLRGERYRPGIADLHVLVIALEHISVCLRLASTSLGDEADELRRRFQREWRKQNDVRDALEHEDELLFGAQKGAEKIPEGWIDSTAAGSVRHSASDPQGVVSIEVLGRVYILRTSIELALALQHPLSLALQEIQQGNSGDPIPE